MADTQGWKEFFTTEGVAYYYNERTQATSWDKPECMMSADEKEGIGSWVWAPHPVHGYVAGQVVQTYYDGSQDLQSETGEVFNVPAGSKLTKCDRVASKKDLNDLVQMDEITEPMITNLLRTRFEKDKIYTNVGTILIAVNPYKRLPLYTPTIIDEYAHKGKRELPPHPFNIAEAAFRNMHEANQNQSILISGESGAGKTETTKQCLTFFAEVAGSVSGVEQNILLANPILEAFGNAKTLRNNNSSRFGKYIEVHFDPQGKICGASTINYLLEKSRVCFQLEGERSFHSFYQLCLGADEQMRYDFYLDHPSQFYYLTRSSCVELDDVDDAKEFAEMMDAMTKLGFNNEEMRNCFRMVAAVLHLGNIEFVRGDAARTESSRIADMEICKIAASMLEIDPEMLQLAMTSRLMEIRGQEATSIPLSIDAASDTRNAMAKTIYYRLFDWLVEKINMSMVPPKGLQTKTIGVLDIFGFEIFDSNSFEQLCINFCNEKLQQHFNQHTFKLEEALYQREGIKYDHIEFIDNQPVLDLIEAKQPQGILISLDEEIVVPRGSDATFLEKIHKNHGQGKTKCYTQPLQSRTDFVIHHYAGMVTYDSTGFLDKNKDRLNKICLDALSSTTNSLLGKLFPKSEAAVTNRVTLGGQFRNNLNQLMTKLNSTEPHYIRCIKPNPLKQANNFEGFLCLQQLRYAGVFEAVAIRKQGFPFRHAHADFVKRYGFIHPQVISQNSGNLRNQIAGLITAFKVPNVQIGKTKVLYRATDHRDLELVRNVEVEKKVVVIQGFHLGWLSRCLTRRLLQIRPILRQAITARTLPALTDALAQAATIEFEILELAQAKALKIQVEREIDITNRLNTLVSQDPEVAYELMKKAVEEAQEINFRSELVNQASVTVELISNRRACRKELASATTEAHRSRLEAAIARAQQLTIPSHEPELRAAVAELERITQEEAHIAALDAALADGFAVEWDHAYIKVDELNAALQAAQAFGCRTETGKRRVQEAELTLAVRHALYNEDWPTLGQHLRGCTSIQFNSAEIKAAHDELSHKVATDEVIERLTQACHEHNQDELAYGLEQADRLQMQEEIVETSRQLLAAIIEARRLVKEARDAVDEALLIAALEYCSSFNYSNDESQAAQQLLDRIREIKKDAATGLHYVEKEFLEKAHKGAEEINYTTPQIDEVWAVLCLSEEKYLQLQLKTAKSLHDPARAIRIMIKLKDVFFETHGTMIVWAQYGNFRTREAFANAQLLPIGREKLVTGMLKWTKKPVPTSLTNMGPMASKTATKLFKNILGFMGDRTIPYPQMLAQDLLNQCLANADLRDEVYCLIIKQLHENPNPQSVSKGWQLMEFCLQTFPPGNDFGNYLEMFLRREGKNPKYIHMLHDTQYGPTKTTAPLVENLSKQTDYKPFIDLNASTTINPDEVIVHDVAALKAALPPSFGPPKAASSSSSGAASSSTPAAVVQKPAAPAQVIPPPPPPEEPGLQQATVLYDYVAQDFRQLTIAVDGPPVYIVGPSAYPGWLDARCDGKEGIIPENYVQLN